MAKYFSKNNYNEDFVVNHKNGNKKFNYYFNLEWVSSKENIHHAIKHGLIKNIGINNSFNKYDEDFIINICELLSEGFGTRKIRKIMNIDKKNKQFRYLVNDIKKKHTWKHISKNYKW